jgi:2,3-bisphosphoglycerate-dependent phosphoglycerate mutase
VARLKVRSNVWPVDSGDFLFAFFSTVRTRLEPDGWGSRFPVVMNELYAGELSGESAPKAVAELDQIREELRKLPPDQLVWDAEDLTKQPPWGENVSKDAADLASAFTTHDGRELFSIFDEAVGYAARAGAPLHVQ